MPSYLQYDSLHSHKNSADLVRPGGWNVIVCQSHGARSPKTSPFVPFVSCCVGQEDATVYRVQELCESRVGRPGLLVPNSAYGLRGRKAKLEEEVDRPCEV